MVRDANRFHHFEDGCLFLHGLLVMRVVCLMNQYMSSSVLVCTHFQLVGFYGFLESF
jgi:hypothetical protein